jgi:hypothetical protein
MAKFETAIIYSGPSLIDGKPITVLCQKGSNNSKTGGMMQTFILRADVDPITANRTGEDVSICGDCPHRGTAHDGATGTAKNRTCYVTLCHAPLGKFKAFKRGSYPTITGHAAIAAFGAGQMVRIGTYGDGAAVPAMIWDSLCQDAAGWTAYTHQNNCDGAATDASRYMTSAESLQDAKAAWGKKERTFRIIADVSDLDKANEILCPASEEAGRRTQCITCKLCSGASIKAKSIAIVAHGGSKRLAKEMVSA